MERFYTTLNAINEALSHCGDFSGITMEKLSAKDGDAYAKLTSLPERFADAMDDDFHTPRAIGYIFDAVRIVNGYMADEKSPISPEACFVLDTAKRAFLATGEVLGLFFDDPDDYLRKDRDREAGKRGLDVKDIERLIEERRAARLAKDWKKADEIRRVLADKKIILRDAPSGTTWKIE